MTGAHDALLEAARAAARRAHGPYSGLCVGAALRSGMGAVYAGCNVENAAFPLGNCAEANAIAAGRLAEGSAFEVAEVAVYAEDAAGHVRAISPCGGCRQRLREFAMGGNVPVRFPWHDGRTVEVTLGELLPYSFELPAPPGR